MNRYCRQLLFLYLNHWFISLITYFSEIACTDNWSFGSDRSYSPATTCNWLTGKSTTQWAAVMITSAMPIVPPQIWWYFPPLKSWSEIWYGKAVLVLSPPTILSSFSLLTGIQDDRRLCHKVPKNKKKDNPL